MNEWITDSLCADKSCVEVQFSEVDLVIVRDASGRVVFYNRAEWSNFIAAVRRGEFTGPVHPND